MGITLATIATVASIFTGQSCAAIDNAANTAAWKVPGKAVAALATSGGSTRSAAAASSSASASG